jgi:hypothetical protein
MKQVRSVYFNAALTWIACAVGLGCAAPGADSSGNGNKTIDELEISEEHLSVDPETGDVFVNLAAIDGETQLALAAGDEESLASSGEDWIEAILSDADVQPVLPELTAAIALDDRSAYDALVGGLDPTVAARHDFDAFYDSGIALALGGEDEEALAAPSVGNCYSYLVPAHGRDRTHFCQEDTSRCHSARHYPCNGDHTNGTFYGYATVTRSGSTACELVRTVPDAVMCHGAQKTRPCNATRTSCGSRPSYPQTSGTWQNDKNLRRDARVCGSHPCPM